MEEQLPEKVKYKFFFGKHINKQRAYLNIRKTHSNLFMTLTDCRGRVVTSKTAAMVIGKLESRRRRKAPQTIEYMIASLDSYFTLYNLWGIKIVLHIRPGQYITSLSESFLSRKLYILSIFNRRRLPFSFTRGRRKKY